MRDPEQCRRKNKGPAVIDRHLSQRYSRKIFDYLLRPQLLTTKNIMVTCSLAQPGSTGGKTCHGIRAASRNDDCDLRGLPSGRNGARQSITGHTACQSMVSTTAGLQEVALMFGPHRKSVAMNALVEARSSKLDTT
jgi:hypothetical protein